MSTSPISPAIPRANADTMASSNNGVPDAPSLNNMFLQLLVAQLQNQNPLNPLDPSQFVGQLAQFSELSEVTSIYQLLQQNLSASSGSGSSGSNPGASGSNQQAAARTGYAAIEAQPATSIGAALPAVPGAAGALSFQSPALPFFKQIQGAY